MREGRHLERGREARRRGDWAAAHEQYALADAEVPLSASDLEDWAETAYLRGDEDEFVRLLDRAHQRYLDHGDDSRAGTVACRVALNLAAAGAAAPASGWFARARRILERVEAGDPAHGYLDLATAMAAVARGAVDEARASAEKALATASQFHDDDLGALALQMLGRIELRVGSVEQGLALLDEAMVTVASGTNAPHVIGIVYCSVIDACRGVYSLRRAHEWTEALTRWCEGQTGLVAFYGDCCVARAEMLVLRGSWHDAEAEAQRATERLTRWAAPRIRMAALYQLAEVRRLRGELDEAEQAYAAVLREGGQAYPGLAMLQLQRGRAEAAMSALTNVLDASPDPARRVKQLPALVEVALALYSSGPQQSRSDWLERASGAAGELSEIAEAFGSAALRAMAEHAAGAVALAAGDAVTATNRARAAVGAWLELSAPYQAARSRVVLARARLAQGDDAGARTELKAARETFEALNARADLSGLDAMDPRRSRASGLSDRELEVLGGIARGASNRAIGEDLGISERTVERHVSNIFDKLGVSSRTEAAAHALRNRLV